MSHHRFYRDSVIFTVSKLQIFTSQTNSRQGNDLVFGKGGVLRRCFCGRLSASCAGGCDALTTFLLEVAIGGTGTSGVVTGKCGDTSL